MDSVEYMDENPWPDKADGKGFTLELKNINLDNSIAQSWEASKKAGGTPGEQNSIVTNVSKKPTFPPSDFILSQNYPNPFNASTHISFTVPNKEKIKVLIFNNQGRLVETLLNGYFPAGRYTNIWDANKHSSGIYFIQLLTRKSAFTIKSLLIK